MKNSLRSFIINLASLEGAILLIPGFKNSGGLTTLVIATLLFSLLNIFVKPVISLLLLPINLITMGTFKWLINVIVLFLVTALVSQLQIQPFTFSGISYQGFIIPKIVFSKFFVLLLASFMLSFINVFLYWLFNND